MASWPLPDVLRPCDFPFFDLQVHRFLDYIIAHQEADGWLGPDPEKLNGNDYWSRFPLLMSMIQVLQAFETVELQHFMLLEICSKLLYTKLTSRNLNAVTQSACHFKDCCEPLCSLHVMYLCLASETYGMTSRMDEIGNVFYCTDSVYLLSN